MEHTNKKTLLILAGGLGSRYKSLKQVDTIHNGSTLLEYSVFDAIRAGFNKMVFIINQLFPKDYLEKISEILEQKNVEYHFIVQETSSFVKDENLLKQRLKPWGTGHALLCASNVLTENFLVINADDLYGQSVYVSAFNYLNSEINDTYFGMISYPLKNTLSLNGSVSRGICTVNKNQQLTALEEIKHIVFENNEIYYLENDKKKSLNPDVWVSMNFWLINPSIFNDLELRFQQFLDNQPQPNDEFWLPKVINDLIEEQKISTKVYTTTEQWKGITYQEDKAELQTFIKEKISRKHYPEHLCI